MSIRKAWAVIGANWGDEGKGHITDFLANEAPNALVVRYNGGAQAGHTVVADGLRHVFHHFGSGHFANAKTLLGPQFIVNPILFAREYNELSSLTNLPPPYVDFRCRVTTPFDMMLNQAIEKQRGSGKHGSCGSGIFETWQRSQYLSFGIRFTDLGNRQTLKSKLQFIRHKYLPERMVELGLMEPPPYIQDDGIIDHFLDDCEFMWENCRKLFWPYLAFKSDFKEHNIIFEGAQGLMLDMDYGTFPHVTPSKTGLPYVIKLAKEVGIQDINAVYVSRTYLTRHGRGPLECELFAPPKGAECLTNTPNEFQGPLRYGNIHVKSMYDRIRKDMEYTNGIHVNPLFALTCADQVDPITLQDGSSEIKMGSQAFAIFMNRLIGGHRGYFMSYGPDRKDIRRY